MASKWNSNSGSKSNDQRAPSSKGNTWEDQEDAFFGDDEPKKKAASRFTPRQNGTSSSSHKRNATQKNAGGTMNTANTHLNTTAATNNSNGSKDAFHSISSGTKKLSSKVSKWAQRAVNNNNTNNMNNGSNHNSNTTATSSINNSTYNVAPMPNNRTTPMRPSKGSGGIFGDYPAARRNTNIAQKPPSSSTTTGVASYPNSPYSQQQQIPTNSTTKDHSKTKRFLKNALLSQVPLRCIHCHAIPLMYKSHPFFGPIQRVCSTHNELSLPKCISCKRYQPKSSPFTPIDTENAHLLICKTCRPSAVMDVGFTNALFVQVLEFFMYNRLDLWDRKMEKIPIHLVSESVLQGLSPNQTMYGSEGIRGLCLYQIQRLMFGSTDLLQAGSNAMNLLRQFGERNATAKSTLAKIRRLKNGNKSSSNHDGGQGGRGLAPRAGISINAILCLKGLPANLTASILAHEATHAWLALNPASGDSTPSGFSSSSQRRLSPQVEEGCCQLVAYLYLTHLLETDLGKTSTYQNTSQTSSSLSSSFSNLTSSSWGEPTEKQLIQFFQWAIENDCSQVYGDGFRLAKKSYSHFFSSGCGELREFLDYVCRHRTLPAC